MYLIPRESTSGERSSPHSLLRSRTLNTRGLGYPVRTHGGPNYWVETGSARDWLQIKLYKVTRESEEVERFGPDGQDI